MAGQMRLVDGYNTRAKAQLAIASAAAERAAAANEVEATGLAEAAALVAQTNGELDTAVASLRAYDKEAKLAETRLQRTVEAALAATQKKCAAPPLAFVDPLAPSASSAAPPPPAAAPHLTPAVLPLRYDALLSLNAADSRRRALGMMRRPASIASSRELGVMKQRLINFRAEGTAAMQVHAHARAPSPPFHRCPALSPSWLSPCLRFPPPLAAHDRPQAQGRRRRRRSSAPPPPPPRRRPTSSPTPRRS